MCYGKVDFWAKCVTEITRWKTIPIQKRAGFGVFFKPTEVCYENNTAKTGFKIFFSGQETFNNSVITAFPTKRTGDKMFFFRLFLVQSFCFAPILNSVWRRKLILRWLVEKSGLITVFDTDA